MIRLSTIPVLESPFKVSIGVSELLLLSETVPFILHLLLVRGDILPLLAGKFLTLRCLHFSERFILFKEGFLLLS